MRLQLTNDSRRPIMDLDIQYETPRAPFIHERMLSADQMDPPTHLLSLCIVDLGDLISLKCQWAVGTLGDDQYSVKVSRSEFLFLPLIKNPNHNFY